MPYNVATGLVHDIVCKVSFLTLTDYRTEKYSMAVVTHVLKPLLLACKRCSVSSSSF
jgi:hypothetical protein